MKRKRLLCVVLSCLFAVLLSSCSGGLTEAIKRPAEVQASLLVANAMLENDVSVSSSDLAESVALVQRACDVIRSEAVLSVLADELNFVTTEELLRMLTVHPIEDTGVLMLEFSSTEHTREQLLEIAHTFCAVVPLRIHEFMSGVNLSVVDMPR